MKKILKTFAFANALCLAPCALCAASVIASVNGAPVTDADITARVKLMAAQGQNYADNRKRALSGVIDDNVKLKYAENFKISPAKSDVDKEMKRMNLGSLSATEREMARSAIKANMAWQIIVARTIMPTISVSKEEIAAETAELERERGLPLEITFIRLVGIPEAAAGDLAAPKDCDDAMRIAESMGGAPQKLTAPQYELAGDIRGRMTGLGLLQWSPRKDNSVILICGRKKMKEYAKLDKMIEQNAVWKKAMFQGDQQLKQLRRKAVVVIMDEKYKLN
jgi:hypothetical protein